MSALFGCGKDDSATPIPTAGSTSAGTSGSAGTATGGSSAAATGGTGGSAAAAGGRAGSSGSGAQSAGEAGADTAGTGGTGGSAGTSGAAGGPPTAADGFTDFMPSADTTIYYVSAAGDDANAGTSEAAPLKTAAAALKKLHDGLPDWILFRRGDKFTQIGQIKASGRSSAEPMLFGSYGDSTERPRFTSAGLNTAGGAGGPEFTSYVAFMGLAIVFERRDPTNPQHDPTFGDAIINWLRGSDGAWFEDCVFQWAGVGFQEFDNFDIENLTFRRCQFLDSYNSEGAHAQNVYISDAGNIVFDECLFDHGGWNESIPGADSTIFNHNIYIQNNTPRVTLKNSISMRASSHGLQFRAGGTIENNFFYRNPISILVGGGSTPDPGGVDGVVLDNVIDEGVNMHTGEGRGWGIDLENIHDVTVDGNIVTHCLGGGCTNIFKGIAGVTYGSNIVYDWPGDFSPTNGNYPNPDVTLSDYAATLNMTIEEFYDALRAQSQFNWRSELTATAINNYFRTAFGQPTR